MDKKLAEALAKEDKAEDAGMDPDERTTCYTHQSWATDCEDKPMHADPHGYILRSLSND